MRIAPFSVAMAYAGTVVGAGFASGQEIWQFFTRFGQWGAWGILLAGAGFIAVGWLALEVGRHGVRDFGALMEGVLPRWAAQVAEGLAAAFLVIGLIVVVSGGGAALAYFGVPLWLGKIMTLVCVLMVAMRGGSGVITANYVVVPVLIALMLVTTLLFRGNSQSVPRAMSGPWFLSAMLYLSYNLFTAVMVLLGLGSRLQSSRESFHAALIAGVLLISLALLAHGVLLGISEIHDLPMLSAAQSIHGTFGAIYASGLWMALVTTGVGGAYGMQRRFGPSILYWLLLTVFLARWGFKSLVGSLYPVMGALAVLLWVPLFFISRGENDVK